MRPSPVDFALTFAHTAEIEPGKYGVRDVVEIFVTPTHLKMMAEALTVAVAAYEETWGEIRPTVPIDPAALQDAIRRQKPSVT